MDQISQRLNPKNHRICSYDHTRENILHLSGNKGGRNDDSSPKLTHLHNYLLISIFDTPEKDVSHSEWKLLTSKVCISSVKSHS